MSDKTEILATTMIYMSTDYQRPNYSHKVEYYNIKYASFMFAFVLQGSLGNRKKRGCMIGKVMITMFGVVNKAFRVD